MHSTRLAVRVVAVVLTVVLVAPSIVAAQAPGDVWRGYVARLEVGSDLDVRLMNGQHFRATFLGVQDDAVLLQPKTRVTVPVQAVRYDAIARIAPHRDVGMSAGKAALIGVASGGAAFLAIVAIVFATVDD